MPRPSCVDVSLTNFAIEMPTELTGGTGPLRHRQQRCRPAQLRARGEGIGKTLANTLQPGDSARLNADLGAGRLHGLLPGRRGAHRAKGMELELTVTKG